MIVTTIKMPQYRWTIHTYISVHGYLVSEILQKLEQLGCKGRNLEDAHDNLMCGKLDGGLTYSDMAERETIMVIGMASSVAQYLNTITHEAFHVVQHICERMAIDMYEEEPCYIMGHLIQTIYQIITKNKEHEKDY